MIVWIVIHPLPLIQFISTYFPYDEILPVSINTPLHGPHCLCRLWNHDGKVLPLWLSSEIY